MPVVAQVVQVIVSMRSAASVTLLEFALIQSYATRTRNDCTPMSVYATMAECRELSRFEDLWLDRQRSPAVDGNAGERLPRETRQLGSASPR